MIVGTTRAGKSTLFNALTSRPMTGKLHDQAQVIYIPDGEAAKTAPGYTSVTLVPNTYNLDDHTSIADMAGYEDSRNHAGVIGVSYLLKAAF